MVKRKLKNEPDPEEREEEEVEQGDERQGRQEQEKTGFFSSQATKFSLVEGRAMQE